MRIGLPIAVHRAPECEQLRTSPPFMSTMRPIVNARLRPLLSSDSSVCTACRRGLSMNLNPGVITYSSKYCTALLCLTQRPSQAVTAIVEKMTRLVLFFHPSLQSHLRSPLPTVSAIPCSSPNSGFLIKHSASTLRGQAQRTSAMRVCTLTLQLQMHTQTHSHSPNQPPRLSMEIE